MITNKLKYLLLLAATGILSILYNEYHMGMIFLTALLMPLLLFGLLSYTYGHVRADIISSVHVSHKGEKIPITIRLRNTSIFPIAQVTIHISYSNSYSGKKNKKDFNACIDRKSEAVITCCIQSEHVGNLVISLDKIVVYDYMKIFSLGRRHKDELRIAVLPDLHELNTDFLDSGQKMQVESDYYSPVKSGDDPSEVFAIREYREGDRQQRIHWKLSRKQDMLMIKDFSEPLNCSILVFANLFANPDTDLLTYMDALLESSLSLSYSFMLKGHIHYFSWYDAGSECCRRIRVVNERDLYEAVDGIMNSIPYTEGIDVMTAYLAEHPNDIYTDLFYVTGGISEAQLNSLAMIRANLRQIIYVSEDTRTVADILEGQRIRFALDNEIMKMISEMGIGLSAIDMHSVSSSIELQKLG